MRLKWRGKAREDAKEIAAFVAQQNPAAAYHMYDEIRKQVGQLIDQPNIGRLGRIQGTRELVIVGLPYIVPYRINEDLIEILRIYHTSRHWPVSLE